MRSGTVLLIGVIALTRPLVCAAQTSPFPPAIAPDRPDFTDSTEVVGHHVLQVETGLRLDQNDATTRQVTTPGMLVRVGLGSRFELRFADDGFISQTVRTPLGHVRTNGQSDVEVAAKVKLLTGDRLQVSLLPFVSLPTASHGLGSGGYDPGLKFAWAKDLPRGVGLSGNVNASSSTTATGRSWSREVSVSAGHSLGGPWGVYWEAYGSADGGGCVCAVDTGVSLAIGTNSQIDVEAGRGIGNHAQNWFIGAGFSVRRLSGKSR
jgi:hypothetical protein